MADETKTTNVNEQEKLSDHDLDEVSGGSLNFTKIEFKNIPPKQESTSPTSTDDVWVDGKIITAE